ncbi:STAS domain-containing protein [Asanoa sp. NPDC050611]|uniref:STAS domain-containing protein n=1 Tax=Asanoa sp. NPDC050611 TaxID=3157098 RepID=UPI0033C1F9BE
MLTISVTHDPIGSVLHLAGELDMESAPQLVACLDDQLAHGHTRIVANLEELAFCDSRGISALIAAATRCQRAGGSLHLTGASGTVARVLEITGVAELLATDASLTTGFGAAPSQRRPPDRLIG